MKVSDIGRWFIVAVLQGLAVLIIGKLSLQCEGNRTVQRPTALTQESVSTDSTDNDSSFDAAWADSISAITGIGYGPYFYDPSWHIAFSETGRTLLYYPRDSSATHFAIPETVQVIEERAFQCNKHLVEIILPHSVHEIGACSFFGCEELREVIIKGPVTSIPWRAFDGCHGLRTVDLPATTESIAGFAFSGCSKLRKLIVRSPEPPVFQMDGSEPGVTDFDWAFNDINFSGCILYVPAESISKYRDATGWNRFERIQAI